MLDRKCNKVIKCCLKHYHENAGITISTKQLQKHLKYPIEELYLILKELEHLDYIDSFAVTEDKSVHFTLGYKAYEYKDYRRGEILRFLLHSIIVPIVVALITSALTTV
ncbi:MAG: hypothetical protein IJ639_05655, partial [Ruminococcus sp.]|nr:hypothetical protein [Ruminococcus sp.]